MPISSSVVIRFPIFQDKLYKVGVFNEFGNNCVKEGSVVGKFRQLDGIINDVLYCGKGIAGFGKNLHRIGGVGRKGTILAGEQIKCGEE